MRTTLHWHTPNSWAISASLRQLAEYEELVSELLSNRFVNIAVTIPVETTPSSAGMDDSTGSGWGAQAGRVSDSSSGVVIGGDAAGGGKLRRDLDLVVQGLLRLGEMERVLGVVQERVSEDLKLIIRCERERMSTAGWALVHEEEDSLDSCL